MASLPKISEAEWQVMRVLWKQSPLTANDVVARLSGKTDWNPRTIKTMLNRLVRKKALAYSTEGRTYQYYPVVTEDASVRAERRSFVRRVYGGALTPMLAQFIEDEDLNREEIEALKRILERKERGE